MLKPLDNPVGRDFASGLFVPWGLEFGVELGKAQAMPI